MFGVTVASISFLSEEEKARYKSVYCGLCRELERRYGQVSRVTLSYDLAFLSMLYMSLHEPDEESLNTKCILDPKKGRGHQGDPTVTCSISPFTSYCADLSVAFAYHKCLDDIEDDGSRSAMVGRRVLEGSYAKAKERIPEQCLIIGDTMELLREYEGDPASWADPAMAADAMSQAFGDMLGFAFESEQATFRSPWAEGVSSFGSGLGALIYLMDAAVDFRRDAKSGSWNPFVLMAREAGEERPDPVMMRDSLSVIAGRAADAFERLPLVQDAQILRSIIYSGVWQMFNEEYEKDDPRIRSESPGRRRNK